MDHEICDARVMGRVAERLGRRGMLAAAAASVVAASAGPAAAQFRATPVSRVVDLTHTLRADFPTFSGDPAFQLERVLTFARDGYDVNRFQYFEHVGTHFDAPIHRRARRWSPARRRSPAGRAGMGG